MAEMGCDLFIRLGLYNWVICWKCRLLGVMQWSNSFEWLANNESCVVWYFLGLGSSWSSANRTSAFLLI